MNSKKPVLYLFYFSIQSNFQLGDHCSQTAIERYRGFQVVSIQSGELGQGSTNSEAASCSASGLVGSESGFAVILSTALTFGEVAIIGVNFLA